MQFKSVKRIVFVKPDGRAGLGFAFAAIPIGLEYVAAAIEDLVDEVHILDMAYESSEAFPQLLKEVNPDLVGISMSATEHSDGLRLASIAKQRGSITAMGGYHPTAIPNELLAHDSVDMVIRGEGEYTMRDVIQHHSLRGVRGLSYKENGRVIHNPDRPLIQDLDALPWPARHLRRQRYRSPLIRGREVDEIHTSRGCWGQCTFCCEPSMSRSRQRYRAPDCVFDEIQEVYTTIHNRRPLYLLIGDPHVLGQTNRVSHLFDRLNDAQMDITFHVMARADTVAHHPKLVHKLCSKHLVHFCMGIESPHHRDLNMTRKGLETAYHRQAVQVIREAGGIAAGTFIIGLPGQREEEIKYFPEYAKQIGLMSAAFGIATPFPSTEFYQSLHQQGLIFEKDWTKYDLNNSVFTLSTLSPQRIEELRTYCLGRFWTPDTFFDSLAITQRRDSTKPTLTQFLQNRIAQVLFLTTAGMAQQGNIPNMTSHVQIFLDALAQPSIERNTRTIRMDQVIDMAMFLRILGPQIIQLTLHHHNTAHTSLILRTTSTTVDSLKIIRGRQPNATITFDVDIGDIEYHKPLYHAIIKLVQSYGQHIVMPLFRGRFNHAKALLKLTLAACTEVLLNR
jgi:magnesium-protoporphyrin IX monomethyl ester (oxidative) cyclase